MRPHGDASEGRSYTIFPQCDAAAGGASARGRACLGGRVAPSAVETDQAGSTPLALAVCVAIASISAGLRQSYGSSFSSLRRARTAPIWSGLVADSMNDDTHAR